MLTVPAGGWHHRLLPPLPSIQAGVQAVLLPGQMLAVGRTLCISCVLYLYPHCHSCRASKQINLLPQTSFLWPSLGTT